ncbi:unnamed protein product [Rhodiola kirilowii]
MDSQPPTPSKLSRGTVQKAVNSLVKWRRAHSSLGDKDDDYFNLIVTLQRIPSKVRRVNYRIDLPTPLRSVSETEICLIVDDRRTSKVEKLKSNASEKAVTAEDAGVSKVLKISKVKANYRALDEKRKLWDAYDVFLAEKRIVERLPAVLGKHFYKNKKKVPLEVEFVRGNWREEVEKAVGSAYMHLSSGTCSVVKVGRCGMAKEEIVENVVAAVEGIVQVMPRRWDSIRSFHLKLNESLALPVYEALPDLELSIEGVEEVEMKNAGRSGDGTKQKGASKNEISRKKGLIEDMDVNDSDEEFDGDVAGTDKDANGDGKMI